VSLLAAALSRAHDFLLAPAGEVRTAPRVEATARSLEVAVVGLKAECGASTVAAGLARALSLAGVSHAHVTEVAPAELVGHSPDLTVLVVPGDVEPALVSLVTGIVGARLGRIVVVANRVRDRDRWVGRSSLCVPDSRIGAVLAGHGRISPGQLGDAFARLAEIVVEAEDRDALR
jgi:hypothetical protein